MPFGAWARSLHPHGMVSGMATKKVTVTLEQRQLDQVRQAVRRGHAASVSGFVQHAVSVALDDVAGWGAMLAAALEETGGPVTEDERTWADEVLGVAASTSPQVRRPMTKRRAV